MSIDFSLRKEKFDSFSLLPAFLQHLDSDIGNEGYRMVSDARNQQWFQLYELINGIISPAHDSWKAGPNTLPFIANLLGAPDLTAFDPAVQNFLVWCWPAIRSEKGVTRSIVSLAGLLGYQVTVLPLWSAFALPNPENLADPVNDPYLAYEPDLYPSIKGVLNQDAVEARTKNGLWVTATTLVGGETVIPLVNRHSFSLPLPPVGFTVFFPGRLEAYTVQSSTENSLTLDQPLSVRINTSINIGTPIPVFKPLILYPASFMDLAVVLPDSINDPTSIVSAFSGKLSVLKNSVIPVRDRVRRVLSQYRATSTYTATCSSGLYGPAITRTATAVSPYSLADAQARADLAAEEAAIALLFCAPEPPVIDITGIEPLALTQFSSTMTYTASCPVGYYGPVNTVSATRTSVNSQVAADQLAYTAARGLAEAGVVCTRNGAPLVTIGATKAIYTAQVSYTAICPFGSLGSPISQTALGSTTTSYADAETLALDNAIGAANALLSCNSPGTPMAAIDSVVYTIVVGVTVVRTCPAGQTGATSTVARTYSFISHGQFQPTFQDAVNLATEQASLTAAANLHCSSDLGPTISISDPVSVYSATQTQTVSCANGLNYQAGNVVTAVYTSSDGASYANALASAGSGATSTATAALNCASPSFNPDSFLLTGKDEFSLDPVLRVDSVNLPFNSGHDFYAHSVPVGTARSDFARFLAEDAPGLQARGLSKIVLEVDWFTATATKAALTPMVSAPFASRMAGSGNPSWAVASYNLGNVSLLPSGAYRGGTVDDAAFKAAVTALSNAGFKVGVSPVVRFVDSLNSVLLDRATVNYDLEVSNLGFWATAYNAFLSHYADLFDAVSVKPWVFYIGNGYRGLTNSANLSQRQVFLQQLITSATALKARYPAATIVYSARHDEYGWNNTLQDFPLDGLWENPNITLGLAWGEPSGNGTVATYNSAQTGATSGEDLYYRFDRLNDANRFLSLTDHAGKTNATATPIYPGIGSKNLNAFISTACWHYVPPPLGFAAGVTPLPGNLFNDANSLGGLTLSGPVFLESRFSWFAPRTYGVVRRPAAEVLTALVFSVGSSATFNLPAAVTAGSVNDVTLELDFKVDFAGNPPTAVFPTIFSMADGSGFIEYDGGFRRVRSQLVMTGANPNFVTPGIAVDDGAVATYYLRYYSVASNWFVAEGYYSAGVLTTTTYPLPFAPALVSSSGHAYLGARTPSTNFFSGSIYRFKMLAVSNSNSAVHYGGVFYFDEAYAGTRTAYRAEDVPVMITELAIPSVEGGLVEPSVEPSFIPGSQMTLPAWLDTGEVTFLTGVQATGVSFSDVRGPYGSTFKASNLHQALGLAATLKALQVAGIQSNVVVSRWDVRSPAAFLARSSGQYVYPDGPLYRYSKVLNGKIVLGM